MHADHLHVGAHRFDVVGHARDQAAAANSHKHGIERALVLTQHFHGNRALTGNDIRVIKGVHKGQALLLLQSQRVVVGVGIAVAKQHHIAPKTLDRVDLDLRRGGRHDDHGAGAQFAGAECHALRVVAGRGANHALLELLGRQVRHLVVSPAQFEAVHGLLVFALQKHLVAQAARQVLCGFQGRLGGHVVHAGVEDFDQVIGRAEFGCGHVGYVTGPRKRWAMV